MNITTTLSAELKSLVGLHTSQPATVSISGPDGVELAFDLVAVDTMSCSLRELRVQAPALRNSPTDVLKKWADALSQRITYLMENIGPLEVDPDSGEVLIRSTPPDKQSDGTRYYEIVLAAQANNSFSLRRYRSSKGTPGREQVDIQTTHELLQKLAGDVVDTIPG